jgi:pSer/pThr/pTyr-binding forkhead associated (FHA) protein
MSDQSTRLTRAADDIQDESMDLSRFIARHHVALVVLQGPHRGAEYPLRRERTVLGRSREATLVFDEETLSREHAAIVYRDGSFFLEDLSSANGCSLNGEPVKSAEIGHGDRIQMGRIQLQLLLEVRDPDPSTHVLSAD